MIIDKPISIMAGANLKGTDIAFDFRQILGSENEFSISIRANEDSSEELINPLNSFAGKSVAVVAKSVNQKLFDISLFISKSASEAEGVLTIYDNGTGNEYTSLDNLSVDINKKLDLIS